MSVRLSLCVCVREDGVHVCPSCCIVAAVCLHFGCVGDVIFGVVVVVVIARL